MKEKLVSRLINKEAQVAVLGLGYVGLPLAVTFAQAGFRVIGIDLDEQKVAILNSGKSYIQDVSTEEVAFLVREGYLQASRDFSKLSTCDAVSICVPTPLRKTGDPDLSYILAATEALAQQIHAGMVVVLESTTFPGTTRELLLPSLTRASGLQVGQDFFLAFSPERVDPGRKDWTIKNTPKVVGGITTECTEVARTWYEQALETVVPVSSAEVAEMTKLLENTFRMVNIAMVNEMVLMCDRLGIDVWEVIEAAATKPFGFMKFTPGPGLGGHCIPIDPLYLSWKLRSLNYSARFINLASEINSNMPRYVVQKVQDALNQQRKPLKGSRVLILGVAYKPDVDDLRESPALDIIGLLLHKGAEVQYHDPYIPEITHDGWHLKSVSSLWEEAFRADCVLIVTNHCSYDYSHLYDVARLIVDTRNALNGQDPLGKVIRL